MNRLLYFLLGLVAAAGLYGLKLACFDGATGTFIARAGETQDASTGWVVRVDADTGRHALAQGPSTFAPPWAMKTGWFVFLENAERAWTFNGDDQLILFLAGTGPFGPDNAPHPVPVEVRHRIGEQRVRQLAANAAEAKQRLGLESAP